ncbi:MAG: HAD family hydrolase [Candidatus Brocadiaceae bacterium]|jgi:putative hydrolase of the HAD superfamily
MSPPEGESGPKPDGRLKAVFFDVRGTLWDYRGCARQVMEIILPKFTPPLPEEDVSEVVKRYNAVFFDLPGPEHIRGRRPFSRRRRFEALLESYEVKKRGLAQKMTHTYEATRRLVMRQFLRAGTRRMLIELHRLGLGRGVIMNGAPAEQRHLVQSLGLASHLDHVILAQIEGYSKPDVRLFRRALQVADVRPEQMLFVGDSPLTDLLGAARAGVQVAWMRTGCRRMPRGWPEPHHTVSRLGDVLDLARRLQTGSASSS